MLLRRWIVPALATALGAGLFTYLGLWQKGKAERVESTIAQYELRAQQPPAIIGPARIEAAQAANARFTVRGRYEPDHQFFVDNRQEAGQAGVHVVTPLRIDQSDVRILINRGWIGWPGGRRVLPEVAVPDGIVEITGTAQVPSTRESLWTPDRQEAAANLWSRVDLARYAATSGHAVQPVVLLQDSGNANDGLVRHWPAPENRAPMHWSYAYQWFGITAALVVFFGYSMWRSVSRGRAGALPAG